MKISTQVTAPSYITNPIPAATSFKEALIAVMYPIGSVALSSIRAANPKTAGTFWLQPIDEGRAIGWGIGSTWSGWWKLEYTMPPHQIDAKNAPYLVFEGRDGHLVRTKSVQHPGHQGNNAVHDAIGVAEAQIRAAIPTAVRVIWTGGQV